ncbi:FAST kinase domain-containing protein 1, mitochondrial isoform 2-T2 [Spinachia spinachia]
MLRVRRVTSSLRRLLHEGAVNLDPVLEQLRVCSAEDQVFDVVGKNRAKLTVNHVSMAVGMLWQFQKLEPEIQRTVQLIRSHPQFLTLRVLAENKIALMNDGMLVDMLYIFLRLNVEPHDSLVQQLVSEAWLRIDRLPLTSLSKFSICLSDQQLQQSPLMGHVTSIVAQRLSSINDARILTLLMNSVSYLASPLLRDALISRAEHLLENANPFHYNNPRRVVQFLRNTKHSHRPLLEKCNKLILHNISNLDVKNISIITGLYQSLQFNNCDFRLAVKQRLTELIDSSTDHFSFTMLFVTLAPMASQEIRDRLEDTALLMANELSARQAVAIAETLGETQSRNLSLMNEIASVIQRNLHLYTSVEVTRIAQALFLMQYQNPQLFTKLRNILDDFLQRAVSAHEVIILNRVMAILPNTRINEGAISRLEAMVTQCNLRNLNTVAWTIGKWVRNDPSYRHNTPSRYVRLLQRLNLFAHERLRTADRLDLLLEELKYMSGDWFEEMLLEETMSTLERMTGQVNCTNVAELAVFLTRTNYLCPPLMERIASVAVKDIDKMHHSMIYDMLLPFSVLNYDPEQADELYDACIQRFIPHISSFDPHWLVLLAYTLSVADCFPEEMSREIFSIDFLRKLDTQLETLADSLNIRTRMGLMQLNRAVCLECPGIQVPWFHERYCQGLQKKRKSTVSPVQQQIHKMLGEVLGGINCVRVAVVTPYSYTIDFECTLDKHLQPLAYSRLSTLQIPDRGQVHWGESPVETISDGLPPGAHRVAVDFLNSKSFCKNTPHMKGEAMMKKRHLEILGYRVVQIPHFEWNSMELSTPDAWKEYLRKNIFKELSS